MTNTNATPVKGGPDQPKGVGRTSRMVIMALFATLIAVGAFIKVPVPMCPFTLQLFFTTMAGMLLGKRYGAISVLVYLAIGLAGVPVFASGGGFSYVLQPTFGYLIGFVIGTYVTGFIAGRSSSPSFGRLLAAALAGLIIVYALGIAYYWMIYTFYVGTGVGAKVLITYCFLLVVPGDLALSFVAAFLGRRLIPVVRNMGIGL